MNQIQIRQSLHLVVAMLLALTLSACGASNPFKAAETVDQRYLAASGTYNIVLESARDIAANPATPLRVVQQIDDVQKITTETMDALDAAYVDYSLARAELAAGDSTEAKVEIATRNLERWIDDAIDAYRQLAAVLE